MSLKTITFRSPEEKIATLDSIATLQQRDRSFLINEAVDQYLSLYEHHRELIKERQRELRAGSKGVSHDEVVKTLFDSPKEGKSQLKNKKR